MTDNMNEAFDQHIRIPKILFINGECTCLRHKHSNLEKLTVVSTALNLQGW